MAVRSKPKSILTYDIYQKGQGDTTIKVYDAAGNAKSCAGATAIELWATAEADSTSFLFTKTLSDFTIGGASNNELTVNLTLADRNRSGTIWMTLRVTLSATDKPTAQFKLKFRPTPIPTP